MGQNTFPPHQAPTVPSQHSLTGCLAVERSMMMYPARDNCTDYLAHGSHHKLPSMSLVLLKLWNRWFPRPTSSV